MFITCKSKQERGNECPIHTEQILTEILGSYQVTTITKRIGSWVDTDAEVRVNEFESEESAREYME